MTPRAAPAPGTRCFMPTLSQRAPRVPRSVLGTTRYFLLQICSCPAVIDLEMRVPSSRSDQFGPWPFYSRRPVRAPPAPKSGSVQ
eukprot:5763742-Prymnesium_polylepis.1